MYTCMPKHILNTMQMDISTSICPGDSIWGLLIREWAHQKRGAAAHRSVLACVLIFGTQVLDANANAGVGIIIRRASESVRSEVSLLFLLCASVHVLCSVPICSHARSLLRYLLSLPQYFEGIVQGRGLKWCIPLTMREKSCLDGSSTGAFLTE